MQPLAPGPPPPLHPSPQFLAGTPREAPPPPPRLLPPTPQKTTPTAVLVPILHKPLERPADRRMVCVTKLHEGARCVPGHAEVAFLGTIHGEPSIVLRESFDPEVARLLDSRLGLAQPEVRQDEEHPARGQVLRLVEALSAHPPSRRILLRQDFLGPSSSRNHVPGGDDLRVVNGFFKQPSQGEIPHGRLVFLEEPVQRALGLHFRREPPDLGRVPSSSRRLLRKQ